MPQKNGLDFLEELKEKSYNLPFILFTGKGASNMKRIEPKSDTLVANG
jgi:FixJ family two-component response regulator